MLLRKTRRLIQVTRGWLHVSYNDHRSSSRKSRMYERDFRRPSCCNFKTPLFKCDFIAIGSAEIFVSISGAKEQTKLIARAYLYLHRRAHCLCRRLIPFSNKSAWFTICARDVPVTFNYFWYWLERVVFWSPTTPTNIHSCRCSCVFESLTELSFVFFFFFACPISLRELLKSCGRVTRNLKKTKSLIYGEVAAEVRMLERMTTTWLSVYAHFRSSKTLDDKLCWQDVCDFIL